MASFISLRKSGMHVGFDGRLRIRARAAPVKRSVEVEAVVTVAMTVAVAQGTDLRRPMNVAGVASWATEPMSAGPNLRRIRPMRSRKKRPPLWWTW
jgi:hypothetical protein